MNQQNSALPNSQDPAWELLAEFDASEEPNRKQQLAEWVAAAVQELGLLPAQVKRIGQAVQETVRKTTPSGKQDWSNLPVHIRIWVSGTREENPSRTSPEMEQADQRERRSWGFFIVEKGTSDTQAANVGPYHVMELYLYEEQSTFKNKDR
jgi:hypothetical protein